MAYSNRKFYFGLGMSMMDFFKEPIRHLKRSMEKESQFEKPYWTGGEYQKMHFAWPDWDWRKFKRSDIAPMRPAEVTGLSGAVGEPSGGWSYKFNPPECHVWAFSMDCGYPYEIGGTTGYVAIDHTPPHDAFAGWTVTLASSPGEDKVELIQEDDGLDTWFFSKNFDLNLLRADFSELTIYATGHFWGEYLLGMDVLGIWNPLTQAYDIAPSMQNRPFLGYPNHPSNFLGGNATEVVNPTIPCEPHTMSVDCCSCVGLAWDTTLSASLIDPGGSVTIAVKSDPEQNCMGLEWRLSDYSKFSLASVYTADGVMTNTLYAEEDACGSVTVTVRACGYRYEIEYEMKCSEGVWVLDEELTPCGAFITMYWDYPSPYPLSPDCSVESDDGMEKTEYWTGVVMPPYSEIFWLTYKDITEPEVVTPLMWTCSYVFEGCSASPNVCPGHGSSISCSGPHGTYPEPPYETSDWRLIFEGGLTYRARTYHWDCDV